jgi:hypothetical protein
MREISHGAKIIGSTRTIMERPDSDTDFLALSYLSSMFTGLSTIKDRTEFGTWFMDAAKAFSTASSSGLSDWCEVFEDHGITIPSGYCS